MSGGKGGSQTTEVKIPDFLQNAAKANIARAEEIAKLGYVPYRGPDVAAFTPLQLGAMQAANQGANAFGMGVKNPLAGIPQAQNFGNGVRGYSSAPLYDQALQSLRQTNPGQYRQITGMFINPVTGADPKAPFGNRKGK